MIPPHVWYCVLSGTECEVSLVHARPLSPGPGDALVIIDVQNDFLPGGALAVPDGSAVVPLLSRCAVEFHRRGLPVFATRDWHPIGHCSFREHGGIWPAHCVAGTSGAAFAAELVLPPGTQLVGKGTEAQAEAYSAFQGTDLVSRLRQQGCTRVFIGGLATDYCVRESALDAISAGLEVVLLQDAVRAVDVRAGDGRRAVEAMAARGVQSARLDQVLA